jgi:hypothetical protein
MSISTAPASDAFDLVLVHRGSPVAQPPASLPVQDGPADVPVLTIHRVTKTHHGRTLLSLGHAAEYLAHSRSFLAQGKMSDSDNEAIHILMSLSRSVFDEYAEGDSKGGRLERLVLGCLTRLLN